MLGRYKHDIFAMTRQGRLSITDIRSSFSEEKKAVEVDNPWCNFVMRPISYYPTWLLLRLGVSANEVTVIGLIIGVIGCVFLAFGGYWQAFAGAILVNIRFLSDVIDGNIARCTDSCTRYGEYLDGISSCAMVALVPISIGIGVFSQPDTYLHSLLLFLLRIEISNTVYLVLGALISLLYLFTFLIIAKFGLTFSIKPRDFYKTENSPKRGLWSIIYRVGITVWNIDGILLPLLFFFTIVRVLSVFLFLWAVIAACAFVTILARTLIGARRL